MFTKVMILFSIFMSIIINLPSGSENYLLNSNSKLLLNNIHTPALALERLLKKAEDPHSEDHKGSFSLVQRTSCKKKIENFFILSHRKVSRLFKVFERPLKFREQITNSSIGVEVLISR